MKIRNEDIVVFVNSKLMMNLVLGAAVLCHMVCKRVHGADTVEPFDVGATDFELYTGVDGLGLGKYEKTVYGDILIGYGITKRLSGYFGATLDANEYLADGGAGFALGGYGNVVDTHHFDFDLFLDFSGGGGDFAVTPSLEFNLDADPDMGTVGVYLRAGVPLYGRDSAAETASEPTYEFAWQIDSTLGAYVTLGDAHQILVEFDSVSRPDPLVDEHDFEIGGIAVGYNVMLTDNLELINQVYLDIPQNDEIFATGLSTGIIATLP